jgi:bacterial/archaeal transporter family protein
MTLDWRLFALASAGFAALTAIFGKLGVTTGAEPLNSNLATLIRTVVIFVVTALLVTIRGEWKLPSDAAATSDFGWKAVLFLVLSGIATGASWLCYYRALQLGPASKVAPVDKLSVAFVIVLAAIFLGETLTFKTVLGAALIVAGSLVMLL